MDYKKIINRMIKEEENRRYYLRILLNKPGSIMTKEFYKKELDICNAKIDALMFVLR